MVPYDALTARRLESVTAQIEGLCPMASRGRVAEALPAEPPATASSIAPCGIAEANAPGAPVPGALPGCAAQPGGDGHTLSSNSSERMQAAAARHAHRPLLKIKLGTPDDMPRLEAVRTGAPEARIIVDANEGWTAEVYSDLAPHLLRLGVEMVEQPLPAGQDDLLQEIDRPLPVCADESCHDRASLPGLAGKYDMVNIKLDKTGGLTEALALKAQAEAEGYGIMVGCMVGSSLAMAPAVLLAQGAAIVDLDGPLLLAEDRDTPLVFKGSVLHPPPSTLWG